MWRGLRVYSGVCPDPECRAKLYFPSYASSSVECTGCGQHHAKDSLLNVEDIQDPDIALRSLLRSVLLGHTSSKTTPDLVKVKGYSNYHCKLLSPLLTHYGMDKKTGEGKLLSEMGQSAMFDCAILGDRAFQIESEHLETAGYGRDKTGSHLYLEKTLQAVNVVNDNEERLIPVHVDGDGHCLVHAISRALVGREIFWHALRANLKHHLETELHKYKGLFRDFIHDDEWKDIISEADPYFQPPPSSGEGLGLRNIHLFGLANVLHRPIILLDSVTGLQSSGDYSGIFLPALIPEEKCKSKDNVLNKPLAVAWSSSGRNHFIPLVGVKGRPVPKLPQWLIPKAWGIPNELVKRYVEFDSDGHCYVGGERCLQEKYLQRLVKAMDDLFLKKNNIAAQLVTEVHQFVYKPSGMVGVKPETVTVAAKAAIADGRLYRCLSCNALCELHMDIPSDLLRPGGELYNIAVETHGPLEEGLSYTFPSRQDLVCVFDAERDMLVPVKHKNLTLLECRLCHGPLRRVKSDGSAVYVNGDRTTTPVQGKSRCGCGFKHYWNGREYENMPESFPISLEWGGKTVTETVYWFQYEQDPSLNSNVYDVAAKLVQKHFPGEFGSERLVQKVVDIILRQTARREGENKGARPDIAYQQTSGANNDQDAAFTPSKIILTGEKKKTLHREELTMSETERVLKTRTEHHAAVMQKRRSGEPTKKTPEKEAKVPKQQTPVKAQQASPQTSPSKGAEAQISPPQPAVKRTDKKVRLSTSDGKQSMLTLGMNTTFKQLQTLIEKELGIPSDELRIRYGFPPRELHPPEEGHEDDPVPLQHGDRVMVEHLKPVVPEQHPPDVDMSEVKNQGGERSAPSGTEAQSDQQRQAQNTAAMTSALLNALGALTGGDMWEAAQNCHEMFERGGFYFNKVVSDLGPLQPNQHCTLPFFPNKVFAYNAQKDRLDLCLGQRHIQVQPLDNETLQLAHTRPAQMPVEEPRTSGLSSEASFSGAIGHRGALHTHRAFSGEGRTLSGAQPLLKPTVEAPVSSVPLANPSSSQTSADQSSADVKQEEVKNDQDQNPKDLNRATSPSPESMVTEQVDAKKEENVQEMVLESPAVTHRDLSRRDPIEVHVERNTQPEHDGSVETEAVCVTAEENEQEMLVENTAVTQRDSTEVQVHEEQNTQPERDGSVETEAVCVTAEENEPEMLVENTGVMQDAAQLEPTEVQVEQTMRPEHDGSVETKVEFVTSEEMETNQGNIENVVDELIVAVNDSTNLSEQEGKTECTENALELMETDQVTVKEDGVTQDVTQVISVQPDDETSKAGVMGGEVNDKSKDSEQDAAAENHASLETSNTAVSQIDIAMEIDTQGENTDSSTLTKHKESALGAQVSSTEEETTAAMNMGTVAEHDAAEALVREGTNLETDGLSTKATSNT